MITITPERPDTADAIALIDELEAYLVPLAPATSRHGYSVAKLLAQGVAFFVLRADGHPAGCGGLQLYDPAGGAARYGEVKRMYVRPQFRGRGLARQMLDHLAHYALRHDVSLLRLETGIAQHEAIALYESVGFRRIPPFGAYKADPLSVFYETEIPNPVLAAQPAARLLQ